MNNAVPDIGKERTRRSPAPSIKPRTGRGTAGKRKGSVLVMDDEELVGNAIRIMLLRSGYATCLTTSGEEAIEQFVKARSLERPFDIVILDMRVPDGMDGSEAMERIRAMDPGVKAILLTGDINHPAVARYEECGFRSVLLKPFTRVELMALLSEASAGEPPVGA